MINDSTEYIMDKYNRTGYLINIGDYYLFQPSELNYNNVSIYERSVPLDFKHNMIKFEIKPDLFTSELPVNEEQHINMETKQGENIFSEMKENYEKALTTRKVERGDNDWYKHCGVVMRKMNTNEKIEISVLEDYLIEHIMDSLIYQDKIHLLNYLSSIWNLECDNISFEKERFLNKIKKYICAKLIKTKNITAIILFDGPSRVNNLHIYIFKENQWLPSEPEDNRELMPAINEKYKIKQNFNRFVGFIGFETNNKYMVYKVKDTNNTRSSGLRCDQSGKDKTIKMLNEIEGYQKYNKKETKSGLFELCVLQEFTLRNFQREKKDGKTWFLDTESAVINEF
jgi:hypothetical protein